MSSALQIQMVPDTGFSIKDLDTLIHALETRVKAREIMHIKEAAEYLGLSESRLYRIPKQVIPYHEIPGIRGRFYIREEIKNKIKTY